MKFLNLTSTYSESRFVVLPVSYGRMGWTNHMDEGPNAILYASRYLDAYDPELNNNPSRAGIYTSRDLDLWSCTADSLGQSLEPLVSEMIQDNKVIAAIGGAHVITPAIVKIFHNHIADLSILVLDGHLDMKVDGEVRTAVSRILDQKPILVGSRSWSEAEMKRAEESDQWERTVTMDYVRNHPQSGVIGRWVDKVISLIEHDNVYISVDLDVLDMSIMPAVGTPEPNGMTWQQLLHLLCCVVDTKTVIGFDVCELCPSGASFASNSLAAKLVYKLIGYINRRDQSQ